MTVSNPPIRVRIVGATDVGLVREHNEDNFIIVDLDSGETDYSHQRESDLGPKGVLLVVCDGMGGAAAGEVASSMAVESMKRQLLPPPPVSRPPVDAGPASKPPAAAPGAPAAEAGAAGAVGAADAAPAAPAEAAPVSAPVPAPVPAESASAGTAASGSSESDLHSVARKLRNAANRANQEIFEAACADIAKAGMGTTLTALMIAGPHVAVAQVGDSRAYLWRKGKLTQITHDQSLVNQLLDSGQITPEQAKLFEHSNVILQALGVQEDVEVVLSSEALRRDDRLLLCSDGLVGVVSDEDIEDVLTTTESLDDAVRALIDMARAGGGPDNITVILAQAIGEGLAEPAAGEDAKYQTMQLEGDRPAERRSWNGDYGYGVTSSGAREMPMGAGGRARWLSPISILAIGAVLAVAVTALVVILVVVPPTRSTGQGGTPPAALIPCVVTADQPGVDVVVDDQRRPLGANNAVEVSLPAGAHSFALVGAQDGAPRSEKQTAQVSAEGRCAVSLRAQPVMQPTAVALDGGTAGADLLAAPAVPAGTASDLGQAPPPDDGDTAGQDAGEEHPDDHGKQKRRHKSTRKTRPQPGETPATPTPATPTPATPTPGPDATPTPAPDKPVTPDKPATPEPATPAPDKPAAPPADKPVEKAPEKPVAPPADKPVDKPAEKAPEKAPDKPAEKAPEAPAPAAEPPK